MKNIGILLVANLCLYNCHAQTKINRQALVERSLNWYAKTEHEARRIAERQGFEGVRWQKMTDPDGGEAPSSVGAFLIGQQPHFIHFAELAYWHWALSTAQKWRERLGLKTSEKYALVLSKLSPLPVQNGIYLATESAKDSYTNDKYLTDHPSVLGAYGMLPATPLLDKPTMKRTFDTIWQRWHWADTWGWDFPMTAMTATRLGLPEKAIDALLMPIKTNTYLINGHNYQDQRLRLYLPGNGGLLAAVALMCTENGFPKDWKVRFEGLKAMP